MIKGGTQAIPIVIAFIPICAFPQQIGSDPLHAKSRELHCLAGRIDITKIRLGNFVFDSHLCEHTTLGKLAVSLSHSRTTDDVERNQQTRDDDSIDDFSAERFVSDHAAISRVLRQKYPTIEAMVA